MIFPLINSASLLHIEQPTFETRVEHAETILFGRFNWAIPINNNDNLHEVYSSKQNTFEFIVYCTIKKSKIPDNVPRFIRIIIDHDGNKEKT
jgi:hemerythrin superfamily protein